MRGLLALGTLGAILGASLHTTRNTLSVEGAANDVVTNTGKVLDTAAADHNNAMLLKVVTFSWDVACYFDSVGKTNSGDLSKS